MDRNTNSRFSLAPQVDIERSTFDRSCTVKTSFNVGDVVPFYLEEILPGDSFTVKTSKIARMQTLKTPMMDDVFLDTYYFFVPNRLVWTHWKEFMGENTQSAWIPQAEYSIPQIEAPSGGWNVGTVADYLGIRPGVDGISVSALPFRAYALICSEWFRDENLQDPLVIEKGDSTVTGVNTGTFVTDVAKGGLPYIACKTHDYFTSALPAPQKGPDVQFQALADTPLPVYTQGIANEHYFVPGDTLQDYQAKIRAAYPLQLTNYNAVFNNDGSHAEPYPGVFASKYESNDAAFYLNNGSSAGNTNKTKLTIEGSDSDTIPVNNLTISQLYSNPGISSVLPVNLVAGGTPVYGSINELRQAFQIQRFYEKCARGGTRYIEVIKSHFGVTSPDARMQRPEYLGGNRLNLNVRQITQTSATDQNSPLGDVAGMSVTTDNNFDFDKSFTEHGYIVGVCVARYHHTYTQGINRTFLRKTKFDYYWPVFAHLGEQPIKNIEIYAQGSSYDDEVFGYQEAWADYRYKPNMVTGMMRPDANASLDTWHLGDDYNSLPQLSSSWIVEDKANLDRVLTVTSAVSNQIFADILVDAKAKRPMPLYSIPGLIDHF